MRHRQVHGLELVDGYSLEGQELHLRESAHVYISERQHSARVALPLTFTLRQREREREMILDYVTEAKDGREVGERGGNREPSLSTSCV